MERFCLSRVSRSGGWQGRAWFQVSFGFKCNFAGYLPFPPGLCVPLGERKWESHVWPLVSATQTRGVCVKRTPVQLSEQLFLWKSRHKLSLSLRKILEVRFHKQLHDCKELQLSSRPGKFYISNFGFICMSCKVSWGSGLNYHCLTARSLRKRNVSACQATQT